MAVNEVESGRRQLVIEYAKYAQRIAEDEGDHFSKIIKENGYHPKLKNKQKELFPNIRFDLKFD